MTLPKLTPEEKTQAIVFILDDDEQQGYDFLTGAYAIDATGKTINQKSITELLINL